MSSLRRKLTLNQSSPNTVSRCYDCWRLTRTFYSAKISNKNKYGGRSQHFDFCLECGQKRGAPPPEKLSADPQNQRELVKKALLEGKTPIQIQQETGVSIDDTHNAIRALCAQSEMKEAIEKIAYQLMKENSYSVRLLATEIGVAESTVTLIIGRILTKNPQALTVKKNGRARFWSANLDVAKAS